MQIPTMTKAFAAVAVIALATGAIGASVESATAAQSGASASTDASKTIVETAGSSDQFSTLVAAVQAAGLAETLQGDGPFTVFAPTNEAFDKLPPGTVDSLLMPENKDKLVQVLTYHVVPGKVISSAIAEAADPLSAETVQGQELSVAQTDGSVYVNDTAKVVAADVMASNGVIHAIDTVLMPE